MNDKKNDIKEVIHNTKIYMAGILFFLVLILLLQFYIFPAQIDNAKENSYSEGYEAGLKDGYVNALIDYGIDE